MVNGCCGCFGFFLSFASEVFRNEYGLVPFLAVTAIASFLVGVASLSSIKVLPQLSKEPFQGRGESCCSNLIQ